MMVHICVELHQETRFSSLIVQIKPIQVLQLSQILLTHKNDFFLLVDYLLKLHICVELHLTQQKLWQLKRAQSINMILVDDEIIHEYHPFFHKVL
jgi:hypothetical protein